MNFTKHGADTTGYSDPTNLEQLQINNNLRYAKWFHAYLRKPFPWEGANDIMEISWYYSILLGRNDIFKYYSSQEFQLQLTDIATTEDERISLIMSTHHFLVTSFEHLRANKFSVIPSVSSLSDLEIQNALQQLTEVLY